MEKFVVKSVAARLPGFLRSEIPQKIVEEGTSLEGFKEYIKRAMQVLAHRSMSNIIPLAADPHTYSLGEYRELAMQAFSTKFGPIVPDMRVFANAQAALDKLRRVAAELRELDAASARVKLKDVLTEIDYPAVITRAFPPVTGLPSRDELMESPSHAAPRILKALSDARVDKLIMDKLKEMSTMLIAKVKAATEAVTIISEKAKSQTLTKVEVIELLESTGLHQLEFLLPEGEKLPTLAELKAMGEDQFQGAMAQAGNKFTALKEKLLELPVFAFDYKAIFKQIGLPSNMSEIMGDNVIVNHLSILLRSNLPALYSMLGEEAPEGLEQMGLMDLLKAAAAVLSLRLSSELSRFGVKVPTISFGGGGDADDDDDEGGGGGMQAKILEMVQRARQMVSTLIASAERLIVSKALQAARGAGLALPASVTEDVSIGELKSALELALVPRLTEELKARGVSIPGDGARMPTMDEIRAALRAFQAKLLAKAEEMAMRGAPRVDPGEDGDAPSQGADARCDQGDGAEGCGRLAQQDQLPRRVCAVHLQPPSEGARHGQPSGVDERAERQEPRQQPHGQGEGARQLYPARGGAHASRERHHLGDYFPRKSAHHVCAERDGPEGCRRLAR